MTTTISCENMCGCFTILILCIFAMQHCPKRRGSYFLSISCSCCPSSHHRHCSFLCAGKPLFWPMFVVVTLASIVASQALISATFSIVSQAIKQGFFPKFRVYHTSKTHTGQICARPRPVPPPPSPPRPTPNSQGSVCPRPPLASVQQKAQKYTSRYDVFLPWV